MSRMLPVLLIAAPLLFTACGGKLGALASGKMPLEESAALEKSLTTEHTKFTKLWGGTKTDAGGLGLVPDEVKGKIDPADLRKQLTDCWKAPIKLVDDAKADAKATVKNSGKDQGAAKAVDKGKKKAKDNIKKVASCPGAAFDKAGGLAGNAPSAVEMFKVKKLQTVDRVRKNLMHRLPDRVKSLGASAAKALLDSATLRVQAEAALKAAQNNPLTSAQDKAKAQKDYEVVDKRLNGIKNMSQQIVDELKAMPTEMTSLGGKVVSDIMNFGGM